MKSERTSTKLQNETKAIVRKEIHEIKKTAQNTK
jgi:hypothetical protein